MRSAQPKQIAEVITGVLEELGIGMRLRQYRVLEIWPQIVGERIASVATAERFAAGRLIVRVAYAPWRNELMFLKGELIAKINRAMNADIVKDINFR